MYRYEAPGASIAACLRSRTRRALRTAADPVLTAILHMSWGNFDGELGPSHSIPAQTHTVTSAHRRCIVFTRQRFIRALPLCIALVVVVLIGACGGGADAPFPITPRQHSNGADSTKRLCIPSKPQTRFTPYCNRVPAIQISSERSRLALPDWVL